MGSALPSESETDELAIERPLEIRMVLGATGRSPVGSSSDAPDRLVSTTMRTPGQDQELAVGFLFGEGILASARGLTFLPSSEDDVVTVHIDDADAVIHAERALQKAERRGVTSSACGVCGRDDMREWIGSVASDAAPRSASKAAARTLRSPRLRADVIQSMPATLRRSQDTFTRTGGLHAAGAFRADGALISAHEDVGRHNAVDKLVGWLLLHNHFPARDLVLLVSGRASFELAQKAARAQFSTLAAVGAPSSLAVDIARVAEMTLVGFVRETGFNVYSGVDRFEQGGGTDVE